MERFVVMLLLCIAPAAQAQHVYKCTQGKSVSYQSDAMRWRCRPGLARATRGH